MTVAVTVWLAGPAQSQTAPVEFDVPPLVFAGTGDPQITYGVPQLTFIGTGEGDVDFAVPDLVFVGAGAPNVQHAVPELVFEGIGESSVEYDVPELAFVGIGAPSIEFAVPELVFVGFHSADVEYAVPDLVFVGAGVPNVQHAVPELVFIGVGDAGAAYEVPDLIFVGIGDSDLEYTVPELVFVGTGNPTIEYAVPQLVFVGLGDTGGQDDVADPPAAGGADDPGEDADPELSGLPNRDMEAQFDPCARLRLLQPGDVEFRFAQLGEILGAASPDSHIDLTLRPIANPYLRRFNIAFGVENAGSVNFSASRQCPVIVRMRSFEGADGQSGGRTGWSPPREVEIGDIAVNAVDSLSFEGSFFGTGNQPIGGWNQNWEYTLVELTVDVPNRVSELAEGDNRIVHCYHAPGQSFVPLSLCGGDQPDEQE